MASTEEIRAVRSLSYGAIGVSDAQISDLLQAGAALGRDALKYAAIRCLLRGGQFEKAGAIRLETGE